MKTSLKSLLLGAIFTFFCLQAYAQNGSIGIGTLSPNPSAALDISSTNKGLLYPRMTGAERRAIASPATGLTVYQTGPDSVGMWHYNGSRWAQVGTQVAAANGLSATGGTVRLGGTVTENTSLSLGTNQLNINAIIPAAPLDIPIPHAGSQRIMTNTAQFNVRMRFSVSGNLTEIRLKTINTPSTMHVEVYDMANNLLGQSNVASQPSGTLDRIRTFATPVPLVAGVSYRFRVVFSSFGDLYAFSNPVTNTIVTQHDQSTDFNTLDGTLVIQTPATEPNLVFSVGSNVGIKAAAPTADLDVNGSVRVRSLTGSGTRMVTTDGNGNLTSAAIPSGADNMGNHTATTSLNLNNQALVNNGTGGIRINSSGQVGVGTASAGLSGARLAVAGGGNLTVNTSNDGTGATDWISANLGAANGPRVVAGLLFGRPTIGGHRNDLGDWNELLINPYGGSVGIGVANATSALDVGGAVRFRNLTGPGGRMVVASADGSLVTQAIPNTSVTGTNGVTASGATVSLGGSLSQSTNIVLGANSLTFTDAASNNTSFSIGQAWDGPFAQFNTGGLGIALDLGPAINIGYTHNSANGGNALNGISIQSTGTGSTGVLTVSVMQSSTVLTTATLTLGGGTDVRTTSFNPAITLVNGQTYTIRYSTAVGFLGIGTSNTFGAGVTRGLRNDGSPYSGSPFVPFSRLLLSTSIPNTPLSIAPSSVGIGTASPSAMLDVMGSTRLRTLTGTGTRMVTTDDAGNLGSATLPTDAQQLTKAGSTISLTNGGSVTDADNQNLTLAGQILSISGGNSVTLPASTDAQTLSTSGRIISISNGNSVAVPAQTISRAGNVLSLTDGGTVTLPDSQQLSISGQTLSISGGNSVTLPASTDAQTLSTSGRNISISNGNSVALPAQTLSKSGNTIALSDGGSVTDSDNQTLSLVGTRMSISGGNQVNLPVVGASSGVENIGSTVHLGGTLTRNTTISANINSFNITNQAATGTQDVNAFEGPAVDPIWLETSGNPRNIGQTLLIGINGNGSWSGSRIVSGIRIRSSSLSSPAFVSVNVLLNQSSIVSTSTVLGGDNDYRVITFPQPINVLPGNIYTISLFAGSTCAIPAFQLTSSVMTGPTKADGTWLGYQAVPDIVLITTTVGSTNHRLTINTTGVGINNGSPTAGLDAIGSVRLRALTGSGARMVTTDADGNLGASAMPTDAQTLSLAGSTLSISGGNSVTLPASTDAQILSISGNNLSISGGNSISLPTSIGLSTADVRVLAPAQIGTTAAAAFFGSWNNNGAGPYADKMLFRTYTDASGGSDNMMSLSKSGIGLRLWQQSFGSTNAFTDYRDAVLALPTGQVGIGTAAAAGRMLRVAGTGGTSTSSTIDSLGYTDWISMHAGGVRGNRVVMGTFNGRAAIGGHNRWLSTWSSLLLNPAGNVGIGMDAEPTERLEVQGNIKVNGTGTSNAWVTSSDVRFKHNITNITGGLGLVNRMQGHRYQYIPNQGRPTGQQIGFIAQELEQITPELVVTDTATGYKYVNYAQVTPVLVEAIKELKQKLDKANAEIDTLKAEASNAKDQQNKYKDLEKRLQAIEAVLGTTATTK